MIYALLRIQGYESLCLSIIVLAPDLAAGRATDTRSRPFSSCRCVADDSWTASHDKSHHT